MRTPRLPASVLLLAASALAQTPATPTTTHRLDDARFAELQRQLTPDPNEPWRTIPWSTDLLAAQRVAAREHKPLFVWAMDGHPLGCT